MGTIVWTCERIPVHLFDSQTDLKKKRGLLSQLVNNGCAIVSTCVVEEGMIAVVCQVFSCEYVLELRVIL